MAAVARAPRRAVGARFSAEGATRRFAPRLLAGAPRADLDEQIQNYFAGGAASKLGILRRARRTLAMSRRRKHVRELVDEPCPELGAGDAVCRVVELRGGNHIEARPVHATPPPTAAAALPPRHPQPRARVPAPPTA